MAVTQADVDAWKAANPDATPDQIAQAASEANVDPSLVAKSYGVTTESVKAGLESYKSGGSAADVEYTPAPTAMDAYKALDSGDEKKASDILNQVVGLPPTPTTLDSGYELTPEETTYRSNLPEDQQGVYDLLLDNKGKSNVEIGKELINAGYSLDQVYAVAGVTDPAVQQQFKNEYRQAQLELGQAPEFESSEYDAFMSQVKGIVDTGALTEEEAYNRIAQEAIRLRELGYTISDAEIARAVNAQFGTEFTEDDVATFTANQFKNKVIVCDEGQYFSETQNACVKAPVTCAAGQVYDELAQACVAIECPEGYQLNEAGTACVPVAPIEATLDGATEASSGSIVAGVPQVGEVNILDYMGLQASQPTLPEGTKLSTQIEKIEPTVGADGEMLELLPDISTAGGTKLGTDDVTATATKVTSEVDGTATVPGQVTVPTSADITTDIVEATEFTEAGVPSQFVDPVTGALKTEDNLATMSAEKSYTDIDTQAKAFTEAKQELADVNPLATVTGQLALLQEQFADGEVPVWASGAFRTVNALMAQRGIGGSTMAAEAITNALMQSAIPIAQQDASFYQNVTLQNLANEQEAEMAKFNARTAAIFNDQAAINAARNLNTQEENALTRFFAELATNVSTTNAEMSNAMEQFNSTAKNQMTQFIEELGLTAETFNADQLNEMSQFDAEQANIISQFNASMKNQREQFNVNNQLAIDASNVQWRRDINTANTAAANAALQFDAQNLLGIQQTALNNIWQHYDTLLNFAYQSEESAIDRAQNLLLATMSADMQRQIAEEAADTDLITGIVTGGVRMLTTDSGNKVIKELTGWDIG